MDRWVTYLYSYYENGKGENAGFVKIRRHSSDSYEATIDLGIRCYSKRQNDNCRIYFIYMLNGNMHRDFFKEINVSCEKNCSVSFKYIVKWNMPIRDGNRAIPDYDGIVIEYGDGMISAGCFKNIEFDFDRWLELKRVKNVNSCEGEVEAGDKFARERKTLTKENVSKNSDFEYILENFEKIPTLLDSPVLKGVKIKPKDIGRLDIANWHFANNSFLNHGYYKYRYLLLGIVKIEDREVNVIGVPGVYCNKEKYMANMLGFDEFVPVKKGKYMTGSFGYWIFEVTKE